MAGKVPLSVVILTKDEASRIAECIRSVEWADEILIVDDESHDDTVKIAQSMGARVLERRMGVEGRHRNWAYAQAKNEWVLSLDADERVTPELAQEMESLLKNGEQPSDIYALPRRNYIAHRWIRHGGWYPSPQVKLFKRDLFQWEETTVHPRAISRSNKPWGTLRYDLVHFSYRDHTDFVGKLNRQTTWEAQKWVHDGRRMNLRKGLWRAIDRFMRTFLFKAGYRDGFLGYTVAVYAGLYQFLSYAKYWDLKRAVGCEEDKRRHAGDPPIKDSHPAASAVPLPQKRSLLSVVILTKNAMATFPSCLASVAWVDEVIVVDGGSTDGTLEVAQAAGAHIVHQAVTDDFGRMRNSGTDVARGDWILQLDADEVVTSAFRGSLEDLLSKPTFHAAYKFRRRNIFLGHLMRCGGWDHFSLHLFRRGLAHYEGRVHEKLLVQGSIGTLSVGVEHFPFRSVEEFVDRQNRYTSLEARQWLESHGAVPLRVIWWQTTVKPIKLFWKMMIKKQGFREGRIGFIFAGLYSFVHFLKWVKVWEILYAER